MVYYRLYLIKFILLGDYIMIKKENIKYLAIWSVITLFYFLLSIWIPLTHDDWTWAGNYANTMISEHFQNLNGRYLGNMGIIIATRSLAFRVISYTIFMILLIAVMSAIVKICKTENKNNAFILLFLFLGLLIIPSQIHKQTISWFSGFYNYIPALLCTLMILYGALKIIFKTSNLSKINIGLLVTASFLGQFFMENHSIFNTFALMVFLILYFIIYKKINKPLVISFVLSIIGAIVMFTNKNYLNILLGNSDYQSVQHEKGFIYKSFETIILEMPRYIFFDNFILLTVLASLCTYLIIINKPKFKSLLFYPVLIALLTLPIYKYFIFEQFKLYQFKENILLGICQFIICFAFLMALIIVFSKAIVVENKKYTLITLTLSTIILAGPLLIVSPIGPRNFFAQHVLWFMILTILVVYLFGNKLSVKFITIPTFAQIVSYLFVFNTIYNENNERIERLKKEVVEEPNKESYTVERLPFEHLMQHSSPLNDFRVEEWLKWLAINEDIKIKFTDYSRNN